MVVKLYSTPTCPRCKILKDKMNDKNIEFTECQDVEEMEKLGIEDIPQLMVNGRLLDFGQAVKYINTIEKL